MQPLTLRIPAWQFEAIKAGKLLQLYLPETDKQATFLKDKEGNYKQFHSLTVRKEATRAKLVLKHTRTDKVFAGYFLYINSDKISFNHTCVRLHVCLA